jgi:glutamate racemase
VKRALIFDSGVGGLSVLDAIVAAGLPLEILYAADNAWLPYGEKSDAALRERVPQLLAAVCAQFAPDIVVVACNTASTIALDAARAAIAQPIVGVVPPIKPAAELSQTGTIGLLATPATVARSYTNDLIARFAANSHVIRFGSTRLVSLAEAKLAGEAGDESAVAQAIERLFGVPGGAEIDVVALACTHFPLLKSELAAAGPPGCAWLDSGAAIARRVANLLELTPGEGSPRAHRALFSAAAPKLHAAFRKRGFDAFWLIGAGPHFEASPDPQ